jgi:hypothetical protein
MCKYLYSKQFARKIQNIFFYVLELLPIISSKNSIDIADPRLIVVPCVAFLVYLFSLALFEWIVICCNTDIMPIVLPLLKLHTTTRMSFHDERFH